MRISWPKRMRPAKGRSLRPGTCSFGMPGPGTPTKASPISAERPRPKRVSARPEATWLATNTRVRSENRTAAAMPARMAKTTPTSGTPVRFAATKPHTAPTAIMPSTPRLRTPGALGDEFAEGGDEERRRGGDDGEDRPFKHFHGSPRAFETAPARGPADQAHAIEDEGVAGEHEEEQHALEDAGDLLGHAEGDLHPLPAEIRQGQQEAGKQDADRIEAAEKRDDDRGEAVAGRDADPELLDRTGDLADAGKAGEAARRSGR